jgi:hypothetical protein
MEERLAEQVLRDDLLLRRPSESSQLCQRRVRRHRVSTSERRLRLGGGAVPR